MKPRTRLSKFLAKIAGVYDGELEPKTEVEQYLNQIAENGGGGDFPIPTPDDAGKVMSVDDGGYYVLSEPEIDGYKLPNIPDISYYGKIVGAWSGPTYKLLSVSTESVYMQLQFATTDVTVNPGEFKTVTLDTAKWVTSNGGSTGTPSNFHFTGVSSVYINTAKCPLIIAGFSVTGMDQNNYYAKPSASMTLYNPGSEAVSVPTGSNPALYIRLAVEVIKEWK